MKKRTKKKIMIWTAGFVTCATAVHLAFCHNWQAVLWCLCSLFLLAYLIVMDVNAGDLQKALWKSAKINKKLTRLLVIEQGRNEAMLANCSRYLKQLTKIKNHEDTHKRGAESAGKGNDED